ncbi:MAG TPA: deoxyribonuclease IV [Planctomycetaceae bacterium]|nr:deoxyribonuclease IV [Planctomycetaceae bacterium]
MSDKHCFGSHVSVAGGLDRGVARAVELGCECLQVFTKNANAWKVAPLTDAAITAWQVAFQKSGLKHPIAHASYLINLASPDPVLWEKSIEALVIEWQRCEVLQIEGLVLHPGAFTTSDEATGLCRVVQAIIRVAESVSPKHCRLMLENTAGQGTCLGHSIKQIGEIIDGVTQQAAAYSGNLAVCIDTCHAFAAGYAIHTAGGFHDFVNEIKDVLPAGAVRAIHLNDSKKPLGSRVDRHEHIGRGELGLEAFRLLLADPLLGPLPGYLETEKGVDPQSERDWDEINLGVLRSLVEEMA